MDKYPVSEISGSTQTQEHSAEADLLKSKRIAKDKNEFNEFYENNLDAKTRK